MNPSQIEYRPKELIVLRASDVYVKHESLKDAWYGFGFETIYFNEADRCYEPNWCNHPLLVVEELEASDNHLFKGTMWDIHTYRSRFVVCLNSDNELVVLPRDQVIRVQVVLEKHTQ
jgi:hypothetical protein